MQQVQVTATRRLQAEDIPALLPRIAEYWKFESIAGFDATRLAAELRRLLEAPALGAGWIAEADGVIVGYLLAVQVFSLEHQGITAEIDEFYVVPEARGRGAGAALLAAAESELARGGCRNISLQLGRNNEAARRFYRRYGYAERSGFDLLDKTLPG